MACLLQLVGFCVEVMPPLFRDYTQCPGHLRIYSVLVGVFFCGISLVQAFRGVYSQVCGLSVVTHPVPSVLG